MAGKQTGLGWTTLTIDNSGGSGQDIRNDVNSFQFATPLAVQDVTGIDKSAYERLTLLADMSITLNGAAINPDANKSHAILANVTNRRTARTTIIAIAGQTLTAEILYTDYSLNRGADGSLPWTAPGVLADGTVPAWT